MLCLTLRALGRDYFRTTHFRTRHVAIQLATIATTRKPGPEAPLAWIAPQQVCRLQPLQLRRRLNMMHSFCRT